MAALDYRLDAKDLKRLGSDLRAMEAALAADVARLTAAAGKNVEKAVKSAASFSKRIPGAVSTEVKHVAGGTTVIVSVDGAAAPHAGPINNGGRGGTFSHPVYGHAGVTVEQTAHPFARAGDAPADQLEKALSAAMDRAARRAGYR